jgi:hypothetical protein
MTGIDFMPADWRGGRGGGVPAISLATLGTAGIMYLNYRFAIYVAILSLSMP